MASEPPKVSVIIPASRNAEMLARCLRSLVLHSGAASRIETIVVLNAARDDVAEVARSAPGARSISSRANLGTSVAWNLAVTEARGELLAMIHDDVEVEAGWLDPLVELLDGRPEVGAAGSLVLNPDGSLQAAGWVLWRDGTTSPPWLGSPPGPATYAGPFPVDYLPGCALVTRRSTFVAVGGADERFHPAYYSDVDLCTAIRARGQLVCCDPRSRVRHRLSATSGLRRAAWLSSRNRVRFVEKWRAELGQYAPFTPGSAQALARAQARTAAEAKRISAAPPPGSHPGKGEASRPFRSAAADLEERWLIASAELETAYAAALSADLDCAEKRLARAALELQGAERERAEADALRTRVATAQSHKAEMDAELEGLRSELVQREAEAVALRRSAAKLAGIEAGGWWRLRERLLPFVRQAARVVRVLTGADPGQHAQRCSGPRSGNPRPNLVKAAWRSARMATRPNYGRSHVGDHDSPGEG